MTRQPSTATAQATIAYVLDVFCGPDASVDEVNGEFYEKVALIDSGVNTADAPCPTCRSQIDLEWVFGTVNERADDLANLEVAVPFCGAAVASIR